MLFKVYTRGHVGRHASLSRVKNDEAVPDGWLGYTRTHSSKGIKSLIVFLSFSVAAARTTTSPVSTSCNLVSSPSLLVLFLLAE
jgi:hypothetical protein